MIIKRPRSFNAPKMAPYQIKHYHTDNIFAVIEVSTKQIMGNFKSLQEAEAFMWSLIPRVI